MQLGVEVRGHRQGLVIHNTLQSMTCEDEVRGHRQELALHLQNMMQWNCGYAAGC